MPSCPGRSTAAVRLALAALLFLALAALPSAPARAASQSTWTNFHVEPFAPCVDDDVRLGFGICTCNTHWIRLEVTPEGLVRLDLAVDPNVVCLQCAPDTMSVPLGRFAAGNYTQRIEIVSHVVGVPGPDSLQVEDTDVSFSVSGTCASPVPYLQSISIGGPAPCTTCPPTVCAGDSIPVFLRGQFGSPCVHLREVRLQPSPVASPLPEPPVVEIVYESCGSERCADMPVPWSARIALPPLPTRSPYNLLVRALMIDPCVPDSIQFLGMTSRAFNVGPACGPRPDCFTARFDHAGPGICDAYLGKNQPAEATLDLFATGPVSGLQGRLQFDQPGLRVSAIEPVTARAILKWNATDDGATFVLLDGSKGTLADSGATAPILRVRVEPLVRLEPPGVVRLVPVDLVASDPAGQDVPGCVFPTDMGVLYRDPAARFCREAACDFNGDAVTDVRDLVRMLRCMRDTVSACTGIDLPRLDCDGDGDRDLDDVLCCARVLLGQGLPDSTDGAAQAPEIRFQFGAPVAESGGIAVPVTLTRAGSVAALRLVFDYPDAVFESASIDLANADAGWLPLDQSGGGHAVFGGIRVAPYTIPAPSVNLDLVLHLRTRAGQVAAGSVRYTGGDFADGNGTALVTGADPVAMPLAGGARLSLGFAHPSPFATETRFSVVLTQDSDLDVAVYDLLGRKVATLFQGRATAGTREFTWRRVRDDGAAVASGVYFYRASANGEVAGRKVLVLSRQ